MFGVIVIMEVRSNQARFITNQFLWLFSTRVQIRFIQEIKTCFYSNISDMNKRDFRSDFPNSSIKILNFNHIFLLIQLNFYCIFHFFQLDRNFICT